MITYYSCFLLFLIGTPQSKLYFNSWLSAFSEEVVFQLDNKDINTKYEISMPLGTYMFVNDQLYKIATNKQVIYLPTLTSEADYLKVSFYNPQGFIFLPLIKETAFLKENSRLNFVLQKKNSLSSQSKPQIFLMTLLFFTLCMSLGRFSFTFSGNNKTDIHLPSNLNYNIIKLLDVALYFIICVVGYSILFYFYTYCEYILSISNLPFSLSFRGFFIVAVKISIVFLLQIILLRIFNTIVNEKIFNIYFSCVAFYSIYQLVIQIILLAIMVFWGLQLSKEYIFLILIMPYVVRSILVIRYIDSTLNHRDIFFLAYLCMVEFLPLFFLV